MTLKEYISSNKLPNTIYIALHNKYNQWVYGGFLNGGKLDDYLDMHIGNFSLIKDKSNLYKVQLIDYEYPLGLNSMRMYWSLNEERETKRKNRKY